VEVRLPSLQPSPILNRVALKTEAIKPYLQWRDRAGVSPASLLCLSGTQSLAYKKYMVQAQFVNSGYSFLMRVSTLLLCGKDNPAEGTVASAVQN